ETRLCVQRTVFENYVPADNLTSESRNRIRGFVAVAQGRCWPDPETPPCPHNGCDRGQSGKVILVLSLTGSNLTLAARTTLPISGYSRRRVCRIRRGSSTSARAHSALYEACEVKHYFTAFSTFFIPVSLFDLRLPFLRPDPHMVEADAR